ncbi:MAG: epoxyqueuosine reductase QueH [Dehalococcoidia bacterium]|nr:epoxyqueuosine reductase QueH [Dehalococcoidia bacterium]
MPSLLLHVCCAHCAAFTINHWCNQGYSVTAFWYNPNIHPYLEHQRRLEAVEVLVKAASIPLIKHDYYEIVKFFRAVTGHEDDRCRHCFTLRLSQTAQVASSRGFEAFSTTILISPYQRHALAKQAGENAAANAGVEFLYADLRKRFSDSRRITRPMELYRQQYCGCLFSEWERYQRTTPD